MAFIAIHFLRPILQCLQIILYKSVLNLFHLESNHSEGGLENNPTEKGHYYCPHSKAASKYYSYCYSSCLYDTLDQPNGFCRSFRKNNHQTIPWPCTYSLRNIN